LEEKAAWELGTITAAFITAVVNGALKQRTNFAGHHFLSPKGTAFHGIAAGTSLFIKLAF